MYLTFAEYTEYGGTLTETAFTSYETDAEIIIDWYTFNRLSAEVVIPTRVKQCMMKLIELLQLRDKLLADMLAAGQGGGTSESTGGGAIRSQSNDGVSISYNALDATELYRNLSAFKTTDSDSEFANTIRLYLNGIKNSKGQNLLYRGLYPGE